MQQCLCETVSRVALDVTKRLQKKSAKVNVQMKLLSL